MHVKYHGIIMMMIIAMTQQGGCGGLAISRRSVFSKAIAITTSFSGYEISYAATSTPDTTSIKEIIAMNEPPPDGTKAPAFTLPNSLGTDGTTSLKQLIDTGKWTILYFFPAAFTSGCTLEARNFQRDLEQYRSLNAQIVGVSVDPPETNAEFCLLQELDFMMLSDVGGNVSQLYGSAKTVKGWESLGTFSSRHTYIIDPNGNLRYIFAPVESIPRHSTEVLEKLKELEGKRIA